MNYYDAKNLLDTLETARIYAGAELERLCNKNQHIDACVFQSIRDSLAQNIQLLQSYVICKAAESKVQDADKGDGNTWYDIPADEMSENQLRAAVKELRKELAEVMNYANSD